MTYERTEELKLPDATKNDIRSLIFVYFLLLSLLFGIGVSLFERVYLRQTIRLFYRFFWGGYLLSKEFLSFQGRALYCFMHIFCSRVAVKAGFFKQMRFFFLVNSFFWFFLKIKTITRKASSVVSCLQMRNDDVRADVRTVPDARAQSAVYLGVQFFFSNCNLHQHGQCSLVPSAGCVCGV